MVFMEHLFSSAIRAWEFIMGLLSVEFAQALTRA